MDLPQDIINIIYTFNADHREQMKLVLKEIKKTYFIWTYKRCIFYNEYYDLLELTFSITSNVFSKQFLELKVLDLEIAILFLLYFCPLLIQYQMTAISL